ncbi:MAG: hypothetical protein AAFY66_09880 [Pseudomonadota bacterium]
MAIKDQGDGHPQQRRGRDADCSSEQNRQNEAAEYDGADASQSGNISRCLGGGVDQESPGLTDHCHGISPVSSLRCGYVHHIFI